MFIFFSQVSVLGSFLFLFPFALNNFISSGSFWQGDNLDLSGKTRSLFYFYFFSCDSFLLFMFMFTVRQRFCLLEHRSVKCPLDLIKHTHTLLSLKCVCCGIGPNNQDCWSIFLFLAYICVGLRVCFWSMFVFLCYLSKICDDQFNNPTAYTGAGSEMTAQFDRSMLFALMKKEKLTDRKSVV